MSKDVEVLKCGLVKVVHHIKQPEGKTIKGILYYSNIEKYNEIMKEYEKVDKQ